jgi:hypothetical protein
MLWTQKKGKEITGKIKRERNEQFKEDACETRVKIMGRG